jgi:hypothetical protein
MTKTQIDTAADTQEAFETVQKCVKLYGVICAIIGVDLIPGVCPAWYATMQAICALPLIAVAIMTRSRRLRSVFPSQKKS